MEKLNFVESFELPSTDSPAGILNSTKLPDTFQPAAWNVSTSQLSVPNSYDVNLSTEISQAAVSSSTQYLNYDVLPLVKLALKDFSRSTDFIQKTSQAFGDNFNQEQGKSLIDDLVKGAVVPNIKILSTQELQAKGAFGGDTIYLSEDLLNSRQSGSKEAVGVLLEEIGHYIDAKINIQDAPDDEGSIFAALVQNQSVDTQGLAMAKI
jgi:hypothetical protein